MSFTRALKRYSRRASMRPATIGLAISPQGSATNGSGRLAGASVGVQSVESVAGMPNRQKLVVRNVPPSPPVNNLPSPPPPAMSPNRAVSSFRFFPEDQRLSQETSPAQAIKIQSKPSLTVAIPERQSMATMVHMPLQGARDSVVTEFAEDGEDSALGPGSAQIWRPPTGDPSSAATYYVADKWGNWVLGGTDANRVTEESIAELATPISKTAAEREAELRQLSESNEPLQDSKAVKAAQKNLFAATVSEAMTSTTKPSSRANRASVGMSTIRLVTPDSGRLPVNSRSSSVYSNYSMPQHVTPTADNPLPDTSMSRGQALPQNDGGPRALSQKRRSGRKSTSEQRVARDSAATVMSQDSATTIIADSPVESATLAAFPLPARTASLRQRQSGTQQRNLSPVVESPGRSPVSYPEIPRSQSNGSIVVAQGAGIAKRQLQNPAMKRIAAQTPFADSPTLPMTAALTRPVQAGMRRDMTPPKQGGKRGGKPASPETKKPRADHGPGDFRTGSPDLQGDDQVLVVAKKRAPVTDRSRLPSQSNSQSLSHAPSAYGPLSIYDAYNDPSRPGSRQPSALQSQQQQQQKGVYEPSPETRQNSIFLSQDEGQSLFVPSPPSASEERFFSNVVSPEQQQQQKQPEQQRHDRVAKGVPLGSIGSNGSALLAKRLGAERAAEFQPIEGGRGRGGAGRGQQWARRGSSLVAQATEGARSITPRNASGPRETYVQLPATPGWQPQLTPKKRGDDLYLSVK